MNTSTKLLSIAAISLSIVVLSGCHTGELAPFDPRSLGQDERDASGNVSSYPMRPLPTTLESSYVTGKPPTTEPVTGPSLGNEPQVRMTLQEMIHRAVINSSDIKTAAYQPAIDETRVTEAEARFDPTFFTNMQYQLTRTASPFVTAEAPLGIEHQDTLSSQVGIRQDLESGGSIDLHQQFQWTHNKAALDLTPPPNGTGFGHSAALQNDLVVELTQPLLRDFGNDINRARIVINRNTQGISLLEYRKQIEQTIADIEKNYWDLYDAERTVQIQIDLVDQTIKNVIRLVNRRGTDVTEVQISQAQSQLESRSAQLVRFKAHVKDLSAQLKRDMQDPDFPISGPTIVLPASPPLEEQVHFDQQEVVDTALANRFELGEQQLRVDSAHTATAVGKNNLLPQLNAIGSIDFEGLSDRENRAISGQTNGDEFSYAFGLELEIPIGNRAARAVYERALMQEAQAGEQYRATVGTVTLDCDTAVREVHTAWEELRADRQAVFAAQNALNGMEQRETAGEALTPEFVQLELDYQDQLASSRRDEATAVANYNKAIAGVEQAQGTLLQFNNIVMERDDLPYERKLMVMGNEK